MKYRIPLFATALLLIGVFAGPLAAAQTSPKLTILVEWGHESMTLPADGKANMEIQVTFVLENFGCYGTGTSGATISADLTDVSNHPKHYGSSLEPKLAKVDIPSGAPGPNAKTSYKAKSPPPVLNIAWDLENIPKKNAYWNYQVQPQNIHIDGGSCVPGNPPTSDPQPKSPLMNVTIPDQPVATSASGATPICTDAFQQGCIKPSNTAPAQSPGFDIALLSLGIVGVLAVFGRRK